ncbi:hypothetical protein [Paenibacillus sp. YN15]|uniref:hypothetical protein n=1 Tax=Paenibacillus sp. YN15 TaxID=1742774 RepID=UPI000DCD3133|nr:hypothetical protein [Paenibacillus sp. YN15]RAV04173.1 hypothetical protein DQG13_06765 [Paenibacillus sp. YN15]
MRRPILNNQTKTSTHIKADITPQSTAQLSEAALEKRLKQKRSPAYMDTMVKLDAAGAVCDPSMVKELVAAMEKEFSDLTPSQRLLGLVARCYLGAPYEVHTLDMLFGIVQHYKRGNPLPNGMEKARMVAMIPQYAHIEVYTNCICAISNDGSVAYTKGAYYVQ